MDGTVTRLSPRLPWGGAAFAVGYESVPQFRASTAVCSGYRRPGMRRPPEASRRQPEQEAQRSVCSQLGSSLYEPLVDIRRRTDQAARELLTPCGHSTRFRPRSGWGGKRTLPLLPEVDVLPATQHSHTCWCERCLKADIDPSSAQRQELALCRTCGCSDVTPASNREADLPRAATTSACHGLLLAMDVRSAYVLSASGVRHGKRV